MELSGPTLCLDQNLRGSAQLGFATWVETRLDAKPGPNTGGEFEDRGTQYRGDLQSLDKKVKINEYINIVHVVYVTEMSVLSVCTLWAFTTHFHVRPSWTRSCHKITVVPTRLKVCKETMKCCPFTSAHDYTNDHTQTHCWVERDSKQQENINTQKMCWIITCLLPFLKKYSTK